MLYNGRRARRCELGKMNPLQRVRQTGHPSSNPPIHRGTVPGLRVVWGKWRGRRSQLSEGSEAAYPDRGLGQHLTRLRVWWTRSRPIGQAGSTPSQNGREEVELKVTTTDQSDQGGRDMMWVGYLAVDAQSQAATLLESCGLQLSSRTVGSGNRKTIDRSRQTVTRPSACSRQWSRGPVQRGLHSGPKGEKASGRC